MSIFELQTRTLLETRRTLVLPSALVVVVLHDVLSCLLRNTVCRHLSVSTHQQRHDTAVDNAQALDATDSKILVDHSKRIIVLSQLTGATRVVGCRCVLLDVFMPVFVRLVLVMSCTAWPGA